MTLRIGARRSNYRARAGFTLIELVLVMAILIVVLSMSGASLSLFFKGRSLEAEGKRFLALTRYAQNRAVSEGLPTTVWINEKEKKYGIETAPGFVEVDEDAEEFTLGRDLEIEVGSSVSGVPRRSGNEVVLNFNPDGFFNETNPEQIVIREQKGEQVLIVPSRNRLYYEITTNEIFQVRR
jgi:prepilin-type N-terminal cleavage/methylation domain-containing protein